MKLRDYQQEIIERYNQEKIKHNNIVIQMPTGTGKSVVAKCIIDEHIKQGHQVLILVPNCTLVDNMKKYFYENSTIIYAGTKPDLNCDVIISTYQSANKYVNKIKRLGLIITDETHHSVSPTLTKIYKKFNHIHKVGFTATTRRADEQGLDQIYTTLIKSHPISWFIDRGYLSDFDVIVPNDAYSKNISEFESEIIAKFKETPHIKTLFDLWNNKASDKKTIVFCSTILQSKLLIEFFNKNGVRSYHLDGTSKPDERELVMKLFVKGFYKVVSNVDVFSEGFDLPSIECVVLNSFDKSERAFYQKLGRGLRPNADTRLLVLDMARNFLYHGDPRNDKEWDIQTRQKRKIVKSNNQQYCAFCEESLGYNSKIWSLILKNDENIDSYKQKDLCCINPSCMSRDELYRNIDGEAMVTTVFMPYKQESESLDIIYSDNDNFEKLDMNQAELTSVIFNKKLNQKKKIDKILAMNLDNSLKEAALKAIKVNEIDIKNYLELG